MDPVHKLCRAKVLLVLTTTVLAWVGTLTFSAVVHQVWVGGAVGFTLFTTVQCIT